MGAVNLRTRHMGKVLRVIVAIERRPFGQGHQRIAKLGCGHEADITYRTHYKVGHRTGCEKCRA